MNRTTTTIDINWQEIGAKLRAPFDPADVDFRPQGKPNKSGKVQAVAYIDARAVADRLDEAVGPGAWSFTYEPVLINKGDIQLAKGRLTVHGVTKEDVGTASNYDPSKGCVSDALKRAAVLWGIGRYLYDERGEWVTPDEYGRISRDDVQRMRAKLPRPTRPNGQPASQNASVRSPQPQQTAPVVEPVSQDSRPPATTPTTPDPRKIQPQASEQQRDAIHKLCNALGKVTPTDALTYAQARELISQLSGELEQARTRKAGAR